MNRTASQLTTVRWLISRTKGVRTMWLVASAARIANQILTLVILVCVGEALLEARLSPWLKYILAFALAKAGLRYLEHFAAHLVAFTTLTRMRTQFYASLVPQAPAVAKGEAAAELSDRATRDIDRVEVFFAHTVPPAISAFVVPLVAVLWAWMQLGARSALVMAVASLLMICIPVLSRKITWTQVQKVGSVRAALTVHLGDSVLGLREVEAFDAADSRQRGASDLESQMDRPLSLIRSVAGVRAALLLSIELSALAILTMSNPAASVASTVLAVLLWIGLWPSLRGVDDFVDGLDDALESTDRVRRTVDAKPLVSDEAMRSPSCGSPADPTADLMSVRGVTFTYPDLLGERDRRGDVPALRDVSVRIPRGEWSYVSGVSGSGKSTLASLLARGYDPDEGAVYLGGIDVREVPLAELRSRVAVVVQHPYLLKGTLRDNLCLSAPTASDDQLWQVLSTVDMEGWASAAGLDQQIQANGTNLSGGQIQRLAIARALLGQPELLVLDEATSQLDESTASRVRGGIRNRYPSLTVLEISHQVDRIPNDAEIVVIDSGEVLEQGRVAQLLEDDAGALSRLLAR